MSEQSGVGLEQYVDARRLHPGLVEKECWNCGHTWFRRARPAESICTECLWGQGDHDKVDEPTDYGALWYDEDLDREEMKSRHAQTVEEMRERRSGHVEVRI